MGAMTIEEKRLQKNLKSWKHAGPKETVFLQYVEDSSLQPCLTAKGEENLKRGDGEHVYYYHSNEGALDDAKEWFAKLNLNHADILFVYGVGLGYDYEAIRPWLKKKRNRRLIFLEDDLAVIRKLFESERGSRLISDPQVELHFFNSLDDTQTALTELYWNFLSTRITISALRSYAQHKEERYHLLKHKLYYDATLRHALLDEYLAFGLGFFRNFYPNLAFLPGSYLGHQLAGSFKDVPAIICGAGPSLSKQLESLKDLKDRALILAGGSAMNVLNSHEIDPHFGAGIDPNFEQYNRLLSAKGYHLPYFFRNRMFHDALKLLKGPRLYIPGSGGYDVAKWFEEKLEIPHPIEELDEGYNVVNFCISIAKMLGCNPIICIGLDLAYTDMALYSSGVLEDSRVTSEEILNTDDLDTSAILRTDIYGKPTYTLWKWIAEAAWITKFSKDNPKINVINATEGGIGFEHVPNIPFKEVIEKQLKKRFNLEERIEREIAKTALTHVTIEKVEDAKQELKESLSRCIEQLQVLAEETLKVIQVIKITKQVPAVVESGLAVLSELELSEEVGYSAILEVFNIVYSQALNSELRKIQNSRALDWRKLLKRQQLNLKRYSFLVQVAQSNLLLIDGIA